MADTTTANLSMTDLVEGAQGQGTRMNMNMRVLDTLVCGRVLDRDLATPPGSPSEGDAYIVATSGTGDWASQDGNIAYYTGSAWKFVTPAEGFVLRVTDENVRIEYDGASWQRIPTSAETKQIIVRIDSPSLDDQLPILRTVRDITINSVRAVVGGTSSPSIDFNIMHNSSRAAAGTQVFTSDETADNTTTGNVFSSGFNDNTIASGRFVWAEMESGPTGTVDWVEFYIEYTEDAP